MRGLTLSLLVVLGAAACRPTPVRDRARAVAHTVGTAGKAVGKLVAPVVAPIALMAPSTVGAPAPAAPAIAVAPIELRARASARTQGSVPAPSPAGRPAPAPQAAPRPAVPASPGVGAPVTVIQRTEAPRTVAVLRGQTHGGRSTCATYPTMAECTRTCTSLLQASALVPPAQLDPGATKSCACLEAEGC
jgi:hypothetical protein